MEYNYEVCHGKTDLKVFVLVIPKEGLAGGAPPIILLARQSFFWYDTTYKI